MEPQSLERSNVLLHDAVSIYGVEEIGTQITEVLLFFYDVENGQNHGMCHSLYERAWQSSGIATPCSPSPA